MMFLFLFFSLHFYTKIDYQYISSVENLKSSYFSTLYLHFTYIYLHLPTLSLHLIPFLSNTNYLFPIFCSVYSTF